MADAKTRLYSLPEITEINSDMYLMLDASATGVRKYNLKTMYDKVDGVQASADAANTAATAAAAAVDSANQAAQQAASAAESATTTVQGLVEDVNEAIEAVGDVTELAVPTMSPTVKGGAKLGTGLEVTDGTLSVNTTASGDGSQAGPILSLDAKGWAEQDTTTGKNLLDIDTYAFHTDHNVSFTASNGALTYSGTPSAGYAIVTRYQQVSLAAGTYTLSIGTAVNHRVYIEFRHADDSETDLIVEPNQTGASLTISKEVTKLRLVFSVLKTTSSYSGTIYPQLELGSTATAYEPYTGGAPSPSPDYPQEIQTVTGHEVTGKTGRFVDLVVKQDDTTLSTTPIPLPSRGWVGSLPDGTADTLTLDGAGKVTWERKTEEITYDGSESWGGYGTQDGNKYAFRVSPSDAISRKSYGIDVLCTHYPKASRYFTDNNRILFNSTKMSVKADYVTFIDNVNATSDNWTAFLAQNPVTVLYPLATPVTEERGYVEMPEIPVGAEISIPELDDLGVRYCVDDAASELARMWYEKAKSEYAEELMELRVTVNELATRIN
jgi:hypothetical protein